MEANKNSQNEDLVRAVVCAGLYPNVAKLKMYQNPKGNSGKEKNKLASKTDTNIKFHKKSVNEKVLSFPYPWVTYHQKMKSHSVSLHDSSVVSPLSLLLFGKHVKLGQDTLGGTGQKVDTVAADDYVKFNCEAATAGLVKELRGQLDELMLHKFTNPAPSNWSNSKKEGLLLDLIVELFGSELSPEISRRISASNNIADFFKLLSKTDDDELILVNSKVPTRLLLSDGRDARELLVKDENANEISSKRFSSSSDVMFLLLRDNSTTVEQAQSYFQTEILQNKSLRNSISQLEREKEAGVISFRMKDQEAGVISLQTKESSVVLYCFPPSEFSTEMLKSAAAKFADEIKKEAYFVVVVMRGGDQPVFDSMEDLLTIQIKSTASQAGDNKTVSGLGEDLEKRTEVLK